MNALEEAGHTVSVIVPHTQRSWIGKAHIVGQDVQATYYWPPSSNPETHEEDSSTDRDHRHPWVLVNSTPASCVQLALGHFFKDREPIDLVVSGPNYGRNTTAVFALSSGTLGAALEASVCGQKALALSFAFFNRDNEKQVVADSCKQGVRVTEWLAKNGKWEDGRLYSVNVPVKAGVLNEKITWTKMLQNRWGEGSCFEELPKAAAVDDADAAEARLRRQESMEGSNGQNSGSDSSADKWQHRHFKWAPRFSDVYESVLRGGPGSDGWAVKEGWTSITAIRANFMHADGFEGEVKL